MQRPPQSANEIAQLPDAGSTEYEHHVRTHGGGFSPETLVHIVRKARDENNTLIVELAGRFLIGRSAPDERWIGGHCEGVIINQGRHFRLLADPETARDYRARAHAEMWKGILGTSLFWENRFGLALKRRCIEVAKAMTRAHRVTVDDAFEVADSLPDSDSTLADEHARPVDDEVLDRLCAPRNASVLMAAVRLLPPRQREAVLLAWVDRRTIEGKGAETVETLMGVGPRGIRIHLQKARETLRQNPEIRAIWFGDA